MTEPINVVEARHEPSEQKAGRFVGMLVFLSGIAMLVLAFVLAYRAFHHPDLIIPLSTLQATPAPSPMQIYLPMLLRLILLFVMGYLGSLIAARGAQLFFSAKREEYREPAGR